MKLKLKQKIQEDKLRNKILNDYQKTQALGSSWNPPPRREDLNKVVRRKESVERRAGFINCKQKYFNKGKYKGVSIKDVPISYIKWVTDTIQLNPTELELIRTILKEKIKLNK